MEVTEAVVAVFATSVVVGVPMLTFAIRFAVRPLIDAYVSVRKAELPASAVEINALRERVDLLERLVRRQAVASLEADSLERLAGNEVRRRVA